MIMRKLEIKQIPFYLAEHCFGFFLLLLFLAIICGGLLFYKYSVAAENQQIEISNALVEFDEKHYQDILRKWEADERRLEQSESKQYLLLFSRNQ